MAGSALEDIRAGGKPALARALAAIEAEAASPAVTRLLDAAHAAAQGHVLGVTGPPGVGKSSLLRSLIAADRSAGRSVAVIAVDPSSRRTGGALLGDRTRLATDPADTGLYVRSMAARDRLGGLAGLTMPAMVLMRALFDRVIVETVGVGQSETDVAGLADTVLFCVQPGSGDSLQFMKAGIVEIPHICAITKADLGAPAERARADMAGALDLVAGTGEGHGEIGWAIPVLLVSAATGAGIAPLMAAIEDHRRYLASPAVADEPATRLARSRSAQDAAWVIAEAKERWGREGLAARGLDARAAALPPALDGLSPFAALERLAARG